MESYYKKYSPSSIDEVIDTKPEMKELVCRGKKDLAEAGSEKLLCGQYGSGKTLSAEILLRQREEA